MHSKIITCVIFKFIINIGTCTQRMQPTHVPLQEQIAGAPLMSTHTGDTSHQTGQYGGQVPTGSVIHSSPSHPAAGLISAGMTLKSDCICNNTLPNSLKFCVVRDVYVLFHIFLHLLFVYL